MKGFMISTVDDWTIGFYYEPSKTKLTIGGNIKFSDVMLTILQEYFDVPHEKVTLIQTAKNKVKFITGCSLKEFMTVVNTMKTDGVILIKKVEAWKGFGGKNEKERE